MRHRLLVAGSLGLVLLMAMACGASDKTIDVAADDPEMVAAITKARETLPQFWKVYDERPRGESDFCLKVEVTDQENAEHFWVVNVERRDGKVFGTINNYPSTVRTVKFGDRIEIRDADVTDWFYMRAGKMVGNYTVRALFKSMSPDEVASVKSMLESPSTP